MEIIYGRFKVLYSGSYLFYIFILHVLHDGGFDKCKQKINAPGKAC